MRRTKEQKALDEELFRECDGYTTNSHKPDGAYIKAKGRFFNLNKIKRLIEAGADVNAKNKNQYGETPLHWALWRDNIETTKLLIDSGADVNAKNKSGITPLAWAVDKRNIELVKLLIKAGATE